MRDLSTPQLEVSREEDLELLRRALDVPDVRDRLTGGEAEAFSKMRTRLHYRNQTVLTEKQRMWLAGCLDRYGAGEPAYENLVSRGLVSVKTKVPTIDALRRENLPKLPPGRKQP